MLSWPPGCIVKLSAAGNCLVTRRQGEDPPPHILLPWLCCCQVEELPKAQMYAKLHAQQHPGTRAHVVDQQRAVQPAAEAAQTAEQLAAAEAAAAVISFVISKP